VPMNLNLRKNVVAASLLVVVAPAEAGAPLVTDDADVIEDKSCQFEAWATARQAARDYWAVPACNFFWNTELSLGFAGENKADAPSARQYVLQVKSQFAKRESVWSIGAVAGIGRENGSGEPEAPSSAYYGKALLSLFPTDDLEVDVNLGASRDFGAKATVAAGLALQYEIFERTTAFAEVFHDQKGPGSYQVGARYAFVPDRFEAYASYGNRLGSEKQWWATAGIRINTTAFLP